MAVLEFQRATIEVRERREPVRRRLTEECALGAHEDDVAAFTLIRGSRHGKHNRNCSQHQ